MVGPILSTGGFFCQFRFGFNLIPAGTRVFVGLHQQISASVVTSDPSATAGSMIGLGMDLGDTNLTIFSRLIQQQLLKLLSVWIGETANTMYDLFIFCTPGGQAINVRLDSTAMPQEL